MSSFRCLKREIVISGSLFLLLLPSGLVDFPDRKQTRSLDNLPSLFHLKLIFGVVSEAVGSLCVRSSAEVEGSLKVC